MVAYGIRQTLVWDGAEPLITYVAFQKKLMLLKPSVLTTKMEIVVITFY